MHKLIIFSCLFIFLWAPLVAQKAVLPPEFHKSKREALRAKMPANSVAVLFSNPIRNRANDVDYVYHPDPNFYYLTGFKEPQAVLVVYKNPQQDEQGQYVDQLFVQERNPTKEQWNGYRLGVEGAEALGVDRVLLRSEFIENQANFTFFKEVLIFEFENDVRDDKTDPYDLYDLQRTFKGNINYPQDFNRLRHRLLKSIRTVGKEDVEALKNQINWYVGRNKSIAEDPAIKNFLESSTLEVPEDLKMQVAFLLKDQYFDVELLGQLLGDQREVKTVEEIALLKKAIGISVVGQREVMKAMRPDMSEREIQGIHEFVFKKYGAAYEGYPSIVGVGSNACVLHYIENDDIGMDSDLMLMDLGAEYEGYTADITRTIPKDGTFSEEQKLIYQIVYDAQEAGIEAAVVGSTSSQITRITQGVVAKGLVRLAIIAKEDEFRTYYPHGAAHHIGLDVHDLSNYGPLKADAIITVEPGIYVPKNSSCDPKWWGIGVRIEDDILITENGPINLSANAPRTWEAIEELMKESSPLDQFILPELEK